MWYVWSLLRLPVLYVISKVFIFVETGLKVLHSPYPSLFSCHTNYVLKSASSIQMVDLKSLTVALHSKMDGNVTIVE